MPTADRRPFVAQAIRCFLAQDYAEKELVIVDDGADAVADLVPDNSRVRYFRQEGRRSVGAKRNFACREARSDIIVHWDDECGVPSFLASASETGVIEFPPVLPLPCHGCISHNM